MERLMMALHYGADAVYLAGKEFGMRAAAGNFDNDELRKAVK
ncbi:MAG: U32 family peptidase, partial [Clostridiales bacterium]|nr:U32 family peptidase [Clostridiales bacterium]